jgi:endonuclease III-like uncharacterized protein
VESRTTDVVIKLIMKKYYFVMVHYTTDFGSHVEAIDCTSFNEAQSMLERAQNTFYDDYDVSYHIEERIA